MVCGEAGGQVRGAQERDFHAAQGGVSQSMGGEKPCRFPAQMFSISSGEQIGKIAIEDHENDKCSF